MITNAQTAFESKFTSLAAKFPLKPFQEKVINQVIDQGSTLAIMPTGGGKSLIYWVAGQALGGTTLVVSPLIALIEEQAGKLSDLGFSVLAIHAGMGASEQMKQLRDYATGVKHFDFIFASPERMATDGYFEYCISLQKSKIKLIVIDEIHCVSQWGFDFRPFYTQIPLFLNDVFSNDWPPVLGLTATINPKELDEVRNSFHIPIRSVLKADITLRFDITLRVEKLVNEEAKKDRLWEIIREHETDKILVYVYRKYHKNGVETLCEEALARQLNAGHFHGDMSGVERMAVIDELRSDRTTIIFATNAFGMGIDIPDIRVVIHFMLPESIEQFYQEVGRGGRDHLGGHAYMLYSDKNIDVRKTHFIDHSFPKRDEFPALFAKVTDNQTGRGTFQYFSEGEEQQKALSYFILSGALSIVGKGFTNLKVFASVNNAELKQLMESTRTGTVISAMRKDAYKSLSCRDFFKITYAPLVKGEASLGKNLEKCLIIETYNATLTDEQLDIMTTETERKKTYKHALLDFLVYLFGNYQSSASLHQEIGKYLGVPKHKLGKIHRAESGDWVRSMAEVVIANLLTHSNIPFKYEEKLYYNASQWKEPDFTITYQGRTWYWEHLGMLGDEKYDEDWKEKKEIYQKMGIWPQVIITRESAVLSDVATEKITKILSIKA